MCRLLCFIVIFSLGITSLAATEEPVRTPLIYSSQMGIGIYQTVQSKTGKMTFEKCQTVIPADQKKRILRPVSCTPIYTVGGSTLWLDRYSEALQLLYRKFDVHLQRNFSNYQLKENLMAATQGTFLVALSLLTTHEILRFDSPIDKGLTRMARIFGTSLGRMRTAGLFSGLALFASGIYMFSTMNDIPEVEVSLMYELHLHEVFEVREYAEIIMDSVEGALYESMREAELIMTTRS